MRLLIRESGCHTRRVRGQVGRGAQIHGHLNCSLYIGRCKVGNRVIQNVQRGRQLEGKKMGFVLCKQGTNVSSLMETKGLYLQTQSRIFASSRIRISKAGLKASTKSLVSDTIPFSATSNLDVRNGNSDDDVVKEGKTGVLLLNLGGPGTLEDVQPFLYNLFADPDIIRIPSSIQFLQKPLASLISTLRAPKSREGYASIGGGSPLREITEQQASALEASLNAKNRYNDFSQKEVDSERFKVFVGMRYWHPFTEEAMEKIKAERVSNLVVLPLYPQFSVSTSGSSLRLLEKLFREDDELSKLPHIVIPSWYQRPGYIESMADLIFSELSGFSSPDEATIFFSAHGVPKSYVEEAGDPYKEEMEECIQLIMAELRKRGVPNSFQLAYQSRVGPVEWLRPYTDDTIRLLGASGCKSMLAVPISFVSEHIETLEEIDMEYRELAIESGVKEWRRVPALGVNSKFIDDLSDAVIEAVPYMGSVSTSSRAAQMRPPADKELVPSGSVEELLNAFDADRLSLPSTESLWEWGWTKSAEMWNGRIAMVACIMLLILKFLDGGAGPNV